MPMPIGYQPNVGDAVRQDVSGVFSVVRTVNYVGNIVELEITGGPPNPFLRIGTKFTVGIPALRLGYSPVQISWHYVYGPVDPAIDTQPMGLAPPKPPAIATCKCGNTNEWATPTDDYVCYDCRSYKKMGGYD